jgi:biotin operon repressor
MGNQDNFDVARLRVCESARPSASVPVEAKQPRAGRRSSGRREEYLPAVEWGWFCRMAALPGKAGWVGIALYRLTVMRKSPKVMVCCRELAEQLGVNRKAVYNAMKALEADGVIRAQRGRGSYATVELLIEP